MAGWILLLCAVFLGWMWFLYWLSSACPVAFWCVELVLLALAPALWVTREKLKERRGE